MHRISWDLHNAQRAAATMIWASGLCEGALCDQHWSTLSFHMFSLGWARQLGKTYLTKDSECVGVAKQERGKTDRFPVLKKNFFDVFWRSPQNVPNFLPKVIGSKEPTARSWNSFKRLRCVWHRMGDEQIDPNLAVAQGKHKLHDADTVSKSRKTMKNPHFKTWWSFCCHILKRQWHLRIVYVWFSLLIVTYGVSLWERNCCGNAHQQMPGNSRNSSSFLRAVIPHLPMCWPSISSLFPIQFP